MLIKLSEQLSFTERMITNAVLPVRYASNYAERHRMLVKAIVDNDRKTAQELLQYNKQKVEDYMCRIVGAFLDASDHNLRKEESL